MAPHGPKSGGAPRGPPPAVEEHPPVKGPHPGYISIANQYTFEQKLRRMQKENGCDPSREDNYRLQGVQLIDNVRESLQLPVRTFDTACTYYHKFRLCFRDAEYNYQDAAMASLFVACKVEDTIKKSKDILCAAYNIKNADHPTTQDDKIFEQPSKIIIGLERLILETIGFDFRVRYPQKLLTKVVRKRVQPNEAKDFFGVAYPMCIDIYKTFSPIKQSTFAMVMSIVELTARLMGTDPEFYRSIRPERYHTTRGCVVESMLDLLDLYTQFPKSTKIGVRFDLAKFIDIKIKINQEVDADRSLARFPDWCEKCEIEDREINPITPGSATSPATTGSMPGSNSVKRNTKGQEGTMRFVFDADEALKEQDTVAEYYKEEYEEYEMEVEEEIPEPKNHNNKNHGHGHGNGHGHGHGPNHGHGSRRDRGHNNRDQGWGPYNRNRHNDRNRGGGGRKGSYY